MDAIERAEVDVEDGGCSGDDAGDDDDDQLDEDVEPLRVAEAPAGVPQKRGQAGPAEGTEAARVTGASGSGGGAQLARSDAAAAPETAPKKKVKADFVLPEEPLAELTFFCLDIETTSNSKKQYDRIIELAIVAYNHRGVELGRLDQRFSNQGVPISPHASPAEGPLYPRPKGRPPAGKQWDRVTGKYVPIDG